MHSVYSPQSAKLVLLLSVQTIGPIFLYIFQSRGSRSRSVWAEITHEKDNGEEMYLQYRYCYEIPDVLF
jgi:hypothetical protein